MYVSFGEKSCSHILVFGTMEHRSQRKTFSSIQEDDLIWMENVFHFLKVENIAETFSGSNETYQSY